MPTQESGASQSASKSTITVTPTATPANTESTAAASGATTTEDGAVATSIYAGTSAPTGTNVPDSDLAMCTEEEAKKGAFPPFCEPHNGTTKYIDTTYLVTWWTGYFKSGTIVSAKLDYMSNDSQNAWHSPDIDRNLGFTYLPVDEKMLQDGGKNSLRMTLVANSPDGDEPAKVLPGPTITVAKPEPTHLAPPPPTTINEQGLKIGLPVAAGVVLLVLAVVFFSTRHHRVIGLGNVMGRRHKGYGVRKSRRQRVGKHSPVGISETELDDAPVTNFRDDPNDGIEMHDRYKDIEATWKEGNVFRDEMERQRTGR